jgi:hypothetical protein
VSIVEGGVISVEGGASSVEMAVNSAEYSILASPSVVTSRNTKHHPVFFLGGRTQTEVGKCSYYETFE